MLEPLRALFDLQVNVWIERGVIRGASAADFEHDSLASRAILQVMSVGDAGPEAGAIAAAQHLLAIVSDQRHLALEYEDKLILLRVPMTLARPGPRRQAQQVHAKLRQFSGVAQPSANPFPTWAIERRGVTRADNGGNRIDVDLFVMSPPQLFAEPELVLASTDSQCTISRIRRRTPMARWIDASGHLRSNRRGARRAANR